ncbi:hypothetical protein AVEN_150010-1 [Araneus ventricosus]|uniref:Uncharacterized protein n=1 Tax=Araneus ventricosus TaxID=182803 RepID=A0A4Y2HRQ5_ARAVE|nr:hypothetical protein AVEN_150010-1 [Araneus ventricosus]
MWLLNIGSGNLPEISGLPCNSIEIPQQMVVEENLIEAIYSENLKDMDVEQLAKRVILAPTNKKTLEMNRSIIAKLQGEPHTFYSSDSIVSEDQNDLQNYPPEFLHDLTPSGMPPHALMLIPLTAKTANTARYANCQTTAQRPKCGMLISFPFLKRVGKQWGAIFFFLQWSFPLPLSLLIDISSKCSRADAKFTLSSLFTYC